jgi:hypothetical protein
MKFDTTVKELQKEKAELEAKLKQVSVALAALSKLGGKQALPAAAPTGATAANMAQAQSTTAPKPSVSPTQSTNKPFGS